jgi:putative transcriptional regulator
MHVANSRWVACWTLLLSVAGAPAVGQLAATDLAGEGFPLAGREQLAPGRFLVAKREMLDPNFAESVVLLIDHGPDGALGIVVNRPSELRLSAISSEIEGFRGRRDPIYVGGPVPGGRIFVLIHGEQPPIEDTVEVVDRVHLSREESALEQLAGIEDAEFRVYVGYAGWAPGQLESEVLRGDWYVLPARDDWVFAPSPDEMWGALVPPEPSRQACLH